ncbi:MAG: glycosyltransferase family 2 protein [Chitinophagaceae bacterium]|nr:glycosyltransferase family 2 protein [Chitinophagaceae bacterium]
MPFISICIPAYQRVENLRRLLNSILTQEFQDFEVIVTDDSPDETVKQLCKEFANSIPLHYFHNPIALGTPDNWNEGIAKATGEWIKIMHDDDWFRSNSSLHVFADAARKNPGSFIFSAFANIWQATGHETVVQLKSFRYSQLRKNPVSLVGKNVIGPPSVTLYPTSLTLEYDVTMKWLVDMDFYIHALTTLKPVYISNPLVNIGIHESQVTTSSKLNPEVEIPEHHLLLSKVGNKAFRNIIFFDAYWRLIRNLGIRSSSDFRAFMPDQNIPPIINSIIKFQNRFSQKLLQIGIASKGLMLVSYLSNYKLAK